MQLADVERILVRAPNWVGDMVMATGTFARIRAAFPSAHVVCGLRPYLRPLLSNTPYFDDFLAMPKVTGGGAMGAFLAQVRAVRRGRFDLAVVLPNSLASGWIVRLAGVPRRLGYTQGRPGTMNLGRRARMNRGLLGRRVGPRRVPSPMPEYYDDLLDTIELPKAPADASLHSNLHTNDDERARMDAYLEERGLAPGADFVLLNAGASFGPSKLWVEERWVELARHYQSVGMVPIFLAGPSEVEMVRRLAKTASALGMTDPVVPLDLLKALLERARLVVSTDTGPRHLGLFMRVPVVCLMGPNDRRYTDYALDRQVVIQKALPCVPCQRKVCPLGTGQCMADISVAEVIEAGQRLLG